MTVDEFVAELIDRHNSADTDSVVLKDIKDTVREITDATRRELFEWYKDNWRSNSCPRAAFFSDRLRDIGQKGGGYTKKLRGVFECGKCGSKYSLCSSKCPRCGSSAIARVHTDLADPSVVTVKPDCADCTIFHDNDGGKFGPECDSWGDGATPYEYCRDCRCRKCCLFEHRFRVDPHGIRGQKMPWIDPTKWGQK